MEVKKTPPIFFERGKTYNVNHPQGHFEPVKVHVDYILDNPTIKVDLDEFPTEEDLFYEKLIVYRVWIKHRNYWKHYVEPFWAFCISNDWTYHI